MKNTLSLWIVKKWSRKRRKRKKSKKTKPKRKREMFIAVSCGREGGKRYAYDYVYLTKTVFAFALNLSKKLPLDVCPYCLAPYFIFYWTANKTDYYTLEWNAWKLGYSFQIMLVFTYLTSFELGKMYSVRFIDIIGIIFFISMFQSNSIGGFLMKQYFICIT